MEKITGKQFAEFWGYAIEKGLMNPSTARALQAAVRQVLGTEEDWEEIDISQLDVDQLLLRFKNKRHGEYKPESLAEYERRFKNALEKFLDYKRDPSAWKSSGQVNRKPKATKSLEAKSIESQVDRFSPATVEATQIGIQMMEYPFPLRDTCVVRLKLPADLKISEVDRLAAFMRTVAVDFGATQE